MGSIVTKWSWSTSMTIYKWPLCIHYIFLGIFKTKLDHAEMPLENKICSCFSLFFYSSSVLNFDKQNLQNTHSKIRLSYTTEIVFLIQFSRESPTYVWKGMIINPKWNKFQYSKTSVLSNTSDGNVGTCYTISFSPHCPEWCWLWAGKEGAEID